MMIESAFPHVVAVYGSLRAGFYNHSFMANAEAIGSSWLGGFRMHDLGHFPGIVISEDTNEKVLVEWYRVGDNTLAELDALEDYFPDAPETSIYLRQVTQSPFGDAWIYLYNQTLEQAPLVESGDWGKVIKIR